MHGNIAPLAFWSVLKSGTDHCHLNSDLVWSCSVPSNTCRRHNSIHESASTFHVLSNSFFTSRRSFAATSYGTARRAAGVRIQTCKSKHGGLEKLLLEIDQPQHRTQNLPPVVAGNHSYSCNFIHSLIYLPDVASNRDELC
jgi:hypothetical protein